MAGDRLRLGIVQMTSGQDLAVNLRSVETTLREGADRGAELVVFPENTLEFRVDPEHPLIGPSAAHLEILAHAVTKSGVPTLLTTPTADPVGPGLVNATWLFEPNRAPRVVYEKIHLFDVDVIGAPPVRESATFRAGRGPALIELLGWRFGLSICYDLRFAELYLAYAQRADVILVPSAFLVPTGRAHWHVLLRAHATEGQCFVAAPAQVGRHRGRDGARVRETFGHALIVDPWGEVVADAGEGPGLTVVDLDRAILSRVRGQIPMADHRRLC